MMRIWHQSITDLSDLDNYANELTRIAQRVAGQDTSIAVHGVARGSYPSGLPPIKALRSSWAHHLLTTQVVMGAIRARKAGFDAVTISCFYDPGLHEAREASGLPVVSACETSILHATANGERAGLLALDQEQQEYLLGLIHRHGLENRVATVVALVPEVTEHDLTGALASDELHVIASRAAERVVSEGAEVVIPAEGVFNARLASFNIDTLAGAPVVDSFAALIKHAERLVAGGVSRREIADQPSLRSSAAKALQQRVAVPRQ